ncbi:contractile injection system protein, VgrG/Pvc8 family [Dichelobacter nodosus]|uniref:contractile injection system protein, VgrG/Pvc8 family n=1 Tax=Dichelobacter nodosus TaxID=870 RepID=UPI0009E42B27|nr:contractile injection system protein, VgrG/Pvc8 family [Dichelobacter nodosus]
MKPFYTLSVDGNPIDFQGRLISMQVIDKNGMEADQLTIDVDDTDGHIQLPRKGALIALSFGFNEHALYIGSFVVDELRHSGPPDTLSISASSSDFRKSLLEEREISYHNTTIAVILGAIAERNRLQLATDDLGSITVEHLDQTNESDANLITRLAEEHDAIGTIKDERLLFVTRATGKTASCNQLPPATIIRNDNDRHDYHDADRDQCVTGVCAYWQDKKTGKRKKVTSGKSGYCRHLKQTYNSEEEANEAAAGKFKRIKTQAKTLTLQLPIGRPDIQAEMPIIVHGFKAEIDAVHWFAKEITHTLNEMGLTTQVDCEELQS